MNSVLLFSVLVAVCASAIVALIGGYLAAPHLHAAQSPRAHVLSFGVVAIVTSLLALGIALYVNREAHRIQRERADVNKADEDVKRELTNPQPVEVSRTSDRQLTQLLARKKQAQTIAYELNTSESNRLFARIVEDRTNRQLELVARGGPPGLRIIGGRPVGTKPEELARFAYQVAVVFTGSSNAWEQFHCGGSLIDAQWVLTAGHCLFDDTQPSDLQVYVGSINLKTGGRFVPIEKNGIHRHGYNSATEENDLALLKLQDPVTDQPIAIADEATETAMFAIARNAIISGWGATKEGGDISEILLWAPVPVVPNDKCNQDYHNSDLPANGRMDITASMLCAGTGQADACQGDSGGPLVMHTGTGDLRLEGIVGWGEGCARPKYPGVYTRVPKYASWIKECLKGNCT